MQFKTRIPFVEHLGLELLGFDPGQAVLGLTLREALGNSYGVAHGGVSMTLLDVAMAHAARTPLQAGAADQPSVVTLEMKTTFMRPGIGRLVATGRRMHKTASLAFCEGSIVDDAGALVAHATGTFKYVKGLTVGDRRIDKPDASD